MTKKKKQYASLHDIYFTESEIKDRGNVGFKVEAYRTNNSIARSHHKPISKIIDFNAPKTSR
jgi:hypothetical protein